MTRVTRDTARSPTRTSRAGAARRYAPARARVHLLLVRLVGEESTAIRDCHLWMRARETRDAVRSPRRALLSKCRRAAAPSRPALEPSAPRARTLLSLVSVGAE